MKALNRKLTRDLWATKTQVVSIALVIACGIGAFIAAFSTHDSLLSSRERYYDSARFPHVFSQVKRAPDSLVPAIRAISGVSEVETRVVQDAQLSIEGVVPPMIARLIGVDFAQLPAMNRLTLKSGRWPAPGAKNEVVVNQRFMEARHLGLGTRATVLLNGKLEHLTIVGTALSPEYIYATRGGGMPDDEWFAGFWTDAEPLAGALDMQGAFNSVLLRLAHGASQPAVIAALDQHVGDALAQLQTLGNGEEVILALGRGVLDKIGIAQLLGTYEHRCGHRDRIIEGEHAHELGGRIAHTRQPLR